MFELREYQKKHIHELRMLFAQGKKRIVYQQPTGGGKTAVFSEITRLAAQKGNKVLIVTDRKELHKQGSDALVRIGVISRELTAKTKKIPDASVCVSMIETLKRRLKRPDYIEFVRGFDLIVVDEIHKCAFNNLFDALDPVQLVLGVSATPLRTGKMRELKIDFDAIYRGSTIKELIDEKFLAPATHFGVIVDLSSVRITAGEYNEGDQGKVYGDSKLFDGVIENWEKRAKGRKTLLFAATVQNSKDMCLKLRNAGITAEHVDGETPDLERERIFKEFESGKYDVLCNCGIATTGYDCPSVSCIVLYRKTKSLPLYLQMIGRGSRNCAGKKDFIVLDFGQNWEEHGFYDDEREWGLSNPKKRKKTDTYAVKSCPECERLLHASARVCAYCGYEYKKSEEEVEEERIVVMLQELSNSAFRNFVASASLKELETIRKIKGYKIGWVIHQLRTVKELVEFEKKMKYKKGFALRKANEMFGKRLTWGECYG